jgi:hypothetical protein
MALAEVCEVREFGMLKQTTPDIIDREKVSTRSVSIAAHVDKSTSARGREGGAAGPPADLPHNSSNAANGRKPHRRGE